MNAARECGRLLVAEGLTCPVLVLSGGVSAGKVDLVPGVLAELGVKAHVHSVALKPGRPFLFATHAGGLVFGLPGNPVSSLVCFELFVRPALGRLMGHAHARPRILQASLAEDFSYRTDRPTYFPARLEIVPPGAWQVKPVAWFGSADLRGLTQSNSFVILPAGDHRHERGQVFPVLCPDDIMEGA